MENKRWRNWESEPPPSRRLIDVVYAADDESDHTWMLMRVFPREALDYEGGAVMYWRPTERLPKAVAEGRKSLLGQLKTALGAPNLQLQVDIQAKRIAELEQEVAWQKQRNVTRFAADQV